MKNLYEVLEVTRNATQKEIKDSYRKLSKIKHPDTSTGSKEEFSELVFAYEVLSNPERKLKYDSTGSTKKEPDFESQFLSFISECVVSKLENTNDIEFDLMKKVHSELKRLIKEFENKEKELLKIVSNLEISKGRFSTKKDENLIVLVIDNNIKINKIKIEAVNNKKDFIVKILDEISNYEYSFTLNQNKKEESFDTFDAFHQMLKKMKQSRDDHKI